MPTIYRNNTRSEKCTHSALGDKSKFYSPPLHIKLSLIKISMKEMVTSSEGFAYVRQFFPKMSEAKMKEGIFIGKQFTQLYED